MTAKPRPLFACAQALPWPPEPFVHIPTRTSVARLLAWGQVLASSKSTVLRGESRCTSGPRLGPGCDPVGATLPADTFLGVAKYPGPLFMDFSKHSNDPQYPMTHSLGFPASGL